MNKESVISIQSFLIYMQQFGLKMLEKRFKLVQNKLEHREKNLQMRNKFPISRVEDTVKVYICCFSPC